MKKRDLWMIFVILFSLIALFGDVKHNRFTMVDFEVYNRTAERIVSGSEIYNIESDEFYKFKYSPTAGIYFIPLSILNFEYAKYTFWILLTILLIVGIRTYDQLLKPLGASKKIWYILPALLFVLNHIHLELHLGQVNMLLLVIYIFLIHQFKKKNALFFALLLSFSLFIKPFGLIFLPYLLVKKEFRMILYTILFIILLSLLPLIFYPSFAELKELYFAWFNEIKVEMAQKQTLFQDGNHTIFSVSARYTPIKYLLINSVFIKIYQVFILSILGLIYLRYILKNKQKKNELKEMTLLTAMIPIIAHTGANAFIFTFPLMLYLFFNFRELYLFLKILLIAGCLLIGGNIYDLYGREIKDFLTGLSIYTFGTLFLFMVFILLERKQSHEIDAKIVSENH